MTQVPIGQLSLREPARCHEVIRAQFGGYERCLYRSKTRCTLPDLQVRGGVHAALLYSLITPPSTFRRWTGASSGTMTGEAWSGDRCWRDWCGRCPL
jgi:hypothetical protein